VAAGVVPHLVEHPGDDQDRDAAAEQSGGHALVLRPAQERPLEVTEVGRRLRPSPCSASRLAPIEDFAGPAGDDADLTRTWRPQNGEEAPEGASDLGLSSGASWNRTSDLILIRDAL
jgi:hypothetical protein